MMYSLNTKQRIVMSERKKNLKRNKTINVRLSQGYNYRMKGYNFKRSLSVIPFRSGKDCVYRIFTSRRDLSYSIGLKSDMARIAAESILINEARREMPEYKNKSVRAIMVEFEP